MLLRNNLMQHEFVKKNYYTSAELGYECNAKKTHTLYAQLQKLGGISHAVCTRYNVNFNLASHAIV